MSWYDNTNYYINNTKLAQILVHNKGLCALPSDNWEDYIFDYEVGRTKRRNHIYSRALLYTEDQTAERDELDITPFDMAVADAINTVWITKNRRTFTIGAIHHIMTGHRSKSLSAGKRDRIISSIEKLCRINIIIDCIDELAKRGMKESSLIEGPFLSLKKNYKSQEGSVNSNEKDIASNHITSYEVIEHMPLYKYAGLIHQFVITPAYIMNIDDNLQSYDDVILLRRELYRKIALLRYPKNNYNNDEIQYIYSDSKGHTKGLLVDIGLAESDIADPSLISSIHNKTLSVLESLKREASNAIDTNDPFILGYEILGDYKTPIGVRVEYLPANNYRIRISNFGHKYDTITGEKVTKEDISDK